MKIFNHLAVAIGSVLLTPFQVFSLCSGETPLWYSTPDLSSVKTCLEKADDGDAVYISRGTATWKESLSVRKPLRILGAGKDETIIRSDRDAVSGNVFDEKNYLLSFHVDERQKGFVSQLYGLTLDLMENSGGILVSGGYGYEGGLLIDACRFKNATNVKGFTARAITVMGNANCVVSGSVFENNAKHVDSYGNNLESFRENLWNFGAGDGLYIEDNTFYITDTPHSCGQGGAYRARFNTYIYLNRDAGLYPWFDVHGNQPNGVYAASGAEIYNNRLILDKEARTNGRYLDQRGGKVLFFNNHYGTFAPVDIQVRNENSSEITRHGGTYTQHVYGSYYWGNTTDKRVIAKVSEGEDAGNEIKNNRDYWYQSNNFDGTEGVGVGTRDNMPAFCMSGTGYWAVDAGGWNTSGQDGALFKCRSQNNWELFYEPYVYPHPARGFVLQGRPTK